MELELDLHEDPQIPNYGPAGKGPRLQEGMVLAIEPMINAGRYQVKTLADGLDYCHCRWQKISSL